MARKDVIDSRVKSGLAKEAKCKKKMGKKPKMPKVPKGKK